MSIDLSKYTESKWIKADDILVQDAEIVGPDKIQLNGTKVGTPAFIGAGTRPCP